MVGQNKFQVWIGGVKMNNIFVWTDEIVEIYDEIVTENIEVSLSLS